MIIAGDIGGTKTNVALFETEGETLGEVVAQDTYPSGQFDSLDAILGEFVASHNPQNLSGACFGVAGPVANGRVETPNLAWVVSADGLAETLGVEHVGLINDLEATAFGIEVLDSSKFFTLNEGAGDQRGHRALIAAGTGLGMAGIFWDGRHYNPMPSEGGHVDFAPRNEREFDLLQYLGQKLRGRVSCERVLSGPGLFNVYSFLKDKEEYEEEGWLAGEIESGDASAAVSKAGLAGSSPLAAEALNLFVEIYGAMAGNLALVMKSTGGLYVGGGIAPKIIEKLKEGSFVRNFTDKGRMSGLVESIPVRVILDEKTALYGAAGCAALHAR